jgi:hypothetical protein
VTNGGFQNFLHAITGLPGGFGTGVAPQPDTSDAWKGPMGKRKRRTRKDEVGKALRDKYYLPTEVALQGDFTDEDEEFLELFFLMDDS